MNNTKKEKNCEAKIKYLKTHVNLFLFLTLFRDIFNTECQVSKPYLFFSNFHIHELSKNVKKRTKKFKTLFFSYFGGFSPANQKYPKSESVRGRRCSLIHIYMYVKNNLGFLKTHNEAIKRFMCIF